MTENRYLAKDSPDAFERERLAQLAQLPTRSASAA